MILGDKNMDVGNFVALMDDEEKKKCLKILAKSNLRLFGDVLVEEIAEEKEKLNNDLGILGKVD